MRTREVVRMLSYIYRQVRDFERQHGVHPNLLYLNQHHLRNLEQTFSSNIDLQGIMDFLEVVLIVDKNTVHPRVAWSLLHERYAV